MTAVAIVAAMVQRTITVAIAALALSTVVLAASPRGEPVSHVPADRPQDAEVVSHAPEPAASSGYDWPLPGEPEVLRHFLPPARVWSPGHRGVDLRADIGAPILAAAGGVVAFSGRVVDRTVVSIDHTDGIRTTYEPLNSLVRAGDVVVRGQVIGYLSTGDAGPHCEQACLHWGARTGPTTYIDPLSLLGLGQVTIRLYPVR